MTKSDHKGENVVSLKAAQQPSAEVALARMPAPMHKLREKARARLQPLLQVLFDKVDDSLFQLADQATNNHEQNLYFDSMRVVRLRRKDSEAQFFHLLDKAFAGLLQASAKPETADVTDFDSLSLVEKDELEEIVACDAMVNKANEQYAEQVQHLALRMDQLVPVKVYQKNNPLGPNVLCEAFFEATREVDIFIQARLLIYKLFDREVMQNLGDFYRQLNQQLVEFNILPSLKGPLGQTGTRPTRAAPTQRRTSSTQSEVVGSTGGAADQGQAGTDGDEVLATLRSLLGTQLSGGAGDRQAPAAGQHTVGHSIETSDLLKLLTLQQRRSEEALLTEDASPRDVRETITSMLRQGTGDAGKINQVDEDVINLVSMMFEFILDDRNLAPPLKALLARLQIPFIKVAIADKTFFGKGGHPARRLLNEMATASLGWQDQGEAHREKDALYKRINQTVDSIVNDFTTDIGIFENLLLEFKSFQEKEKRRAQILEQRTIDAEDGKAKSQKARNSVDLALDELVAGHELPGEIAQLLTAAWSNVLFVTCLKEGEDSEKFEAQLATARELVWSGTASMAGDNRRKLLKLVPTLLDRLRKGLEDIAFNPYQMGQMFKALERLHLQMLRGKPVAPVEAKAATSAPGVAKREPAAPTVAEKAHQAAAVPLAEPSTATRSAEAPVSATPTAAGKEVEVAETETKSAGNSQGNGASLENAQVENSEAPVKEGVSQETIDSQTLALVSNLSQGTWFEMQANTGESYRCRLAAIIKPTGKYIFVNRTGMKVAEETKEALAYALRDGRIRLLDDGMLFDRALESVIGNLRKSRS